MPNGSQRNWIRRVGGSETDREKRPVSPRSMNPLSHSAESLISTTATRRKDCLSGVGWEGGGAGKGSPDSSGRRGGAVGAPRQATTERGVGEGAPNKHGPLARRGGSGPEKRRERG